MMCAFMTPVLKNDWEIYKTRRTRNNSESSQLSDRSHHSHHHSHHHQQPGRSTSHSNSKRRALGDSGRSHSYHAPNHAHVRGENLGLVGSPPRAYHMSTKNSRYASRTSMDPHSPGTTSPPISPLATHNTGSSGTHSRGPTKSPSSHSLTKFHSKVMDKLKNVLHLKDDRREEDRGEDQEDGGTRGQS